MSGSKILSEKIIKLIGPPKRGKQSLKNRPATADLTVNQQASSGNDQIDSDCITVVTRVTAQILWGKWGVGTTAQPDGATAPKKPSAVLDSFSDTGSFGYSKTNDTMPLLSGIGTAGDAITIRDSGGNVIATAIVAGDGSWIAMPITALSEGRNTLSVTAADTAGNISQPATLTITVDTTVAAPVIARADDSGAVAGTGEPGATITIMDGAALLGIALVDATGYWNFTPATPIIEGSVLSAAQTDLMGNVSTATLKTVVSSVSVISSPDGLVVNGGDKPSDIVTLTLTWAGDGELRDANGKLLTSVLAANGAWVVSPPETPMKHRQSTVAVP